jgi:hypothetical protein
MQTFNFCLDELKDIIADMRSCDDKDILFEKAIVTFVRFNNSMGSVDDITNEDKRKYYLILDGIFENHIIPHISAKQYLKWLTLRKKTIPKNEETKRIPNSQNTYIGKYRHRRFLKKHDI